MFCRFHSVTMTPLPRSVCQHVHSCLLYTGASYSPSFTCRRGGGRGPVGQPTDPGSPRTHTHTHDRFMALFPGPPKWAGARRNLVGFYGAVEDNRGRHTDCLGGRHSIQANNRSTSVIPPFLCRMPCCRNPPNLCGLAWFGSSGTRPLNRAVCVYSTAGWMLGAVDYQERSVSVLHVEWYIKLCWLTHSGNWTVFCMFIPNFRCPLSAFMLVAGWQEGQPACKKSHSTYPQRVSCGKDGGWGPEGRTEWHRFGWKKTAIKRK